MNLSRLPAIANPLAVILTGKLGSGKVGFAAADGLCDARYSNRG
jgi:hypothetical protein